MKLEVTLKVDTDGLLTVTAKQEGTDGAYNEATIIPPKDQLSEDEIAQFRQGQEDQQAMRAAFEAFMVED